MLSEFDLEI